MSTCPSCGDDANVDKVTGIYRAQSAGYGGSNLSRLLAPPQIDAALPRWDDMEQGCVNRVLAITVFIGVVTSLYMSAAYGWGAPNLIVGFILGVIFGIGPTVAIMWMLLHRHFSELEKVTIAEAKSKRQSPEHLRRVEQWERAWYCRKHDAVILEDGKVLSPTEFRSLMTGDA